MTGFARHWGAGPRDVLLLHCSLAQSGAWQGVANMLPQDLRLTAPDLVGHGAGPDYDPACDLHDQCFAALMEHLPKGRFDAVGHSLGATLALRLAIEMPDRVRSLTLIEPVLFAAVRGTDMWHRHLESEGPYKQAALAGNSHEAARHFIDLWGTGVALDDMPASPRNYIQDRIDLIGISEVALCEDSPGLVGRLGQVAVPALLIEGGNCLPVITGILDRFEQDIAETTRLSIPGAGHMAPITHPHPVAQAIAAHLAQISP